MWKDPIVEEVRKVREEYLAQFNYDLDAVFKDLKRIERESGRKTCSFKPKPTQEIRKAV